MPISPNNFEPNNFEPDKFEFAATKMHSQRRLAQRVSQPASFLEQSEDSPVDLASLLRRHLAPAILLTALGLLLALAMLVLATPLYRAQVILEIQPGSKDLGGQTMDPFAALHDMDATNLQTQLVLLQSGPFKGRVLARLAALPAPRPQPAAGLFSKIRARLRPASVSAAASAPNALRSAAESLDARIINQTRLVQLSCESPNAVVTSTFLNAFADEFVEDSIRERSEASEKTTAWLSSHIEDTRARLQDADARLRSFMLRSGNEFAASDTTVDDVKLKQLQAELAVAQGVEIAKQAAYETAVKSPHDAIPELQADPIAASVRSELAELEKQKAILLLTLTPLNPKVTAIQEQERNLEGTLRREEATLLARLQSEYESARDHENLLYKAYAAESEQVGLQAPKATEYAALKREVDRYQKTYDSLMGELNKTQVAQSAPLNPVSLVAPSEPPAAPYTPQPKSTLLLGAMGGLAVAVGLAFVREKVDRRLRSPESLRSLVRVPQLGVIPAGPAGWGGKRRALPAPARPSGAVFSLLTSGDAQDGASQQLALAAWSEGPAALLADSFRATLASLLRQLGEEQNGKVIVVTSGTPGEGKTTVVTHLGIALSEAGGRVAVVDADFRRPCLSSVFGIESAVSLRQILEERRPLESYPSGSLAAPSQYPGLFVLPCNGAAASVPSLVYSKRLPELLARLRREFDLVLVDVPPVLFPADARVVARLADAAVLVIRSDYAEKENIRSAVNILHEDGIPILGTIFNDWTPSGSAGALRYYKYYAKQKNDLS